MAANAINIEPCDSYPCKCLALDRSHSYRRGSRAVRGTVRAADGSAGLGGKNASGRSAPTECNRPDSAPTQRNRAGSRLAESRTSEPTTCCTTERNRQTVWREWTGSGAEGERKPPATRREAG